MHERGHTNNALVELKQSVARVSNTKNGQKNGEEKHPFFRNLLQALGCSEHSGAMVPQNARNKGEVAVCTEEVHTITERAGQTEEAKRSHLSPDFHFGKVNRKNLGITAI